MAILINKYNSFFFFFFSFFAFHNPGFTFQVRETTCTYLNAVNKVGKKFN